MVSGAAEGMVDETVLRRLILEVALTPGPIYGGQGKAYLRKRIGGYNLAAWHSPWVVLTDLDQEFECAPELRRAWLPSPAALMCFRIAVRQVESWLLADRERIAAFLGVSSTKVPSDPDAEPSAKIALVSLARSSRLRRIREGIVPRPGSGRAVGDTYASELMGFINGAWSPGAAAERSDSLRRCLTSLRELSAKVQS